MRIGDGSSGEEGLKGESGELKVENFLLIYVKKYCR